MTWARYNVSIKNRAILALLIGCGQMPTREAMPSLPLCWLAGFMKFFAHAARSPQFILLSCSGGHCSNQHIDIGCWPAWQILRRSGHVVKQEVNLSGKRDDNRDLGRDKAMG
jgi:hypothetical protein